MRTILLVSSCICIYSKVVSYLMSIPYMLAGIALVVLGVSYTHPPVARYFIQLFNEFNGRASHITPRTIRMQKVQGYAIILFGAFIIIATLLGYLD